MANPTHPGYSQSDKDATGDTLQPPAAVPAPSPSLPWFETRSAQMKKVLDAAYRAALTPAPILLTGEPGVGKGALARQIHEWSRWRRQSFVVVDCASVSEHLPEYAPLDQVTAWLIGSSREGGQAETGAQDTIFFDNISELCELGQVGLLRFLEEQNFQSVFEQSPVIGRHRIIAACNRNLAAEVAARRFREDLFFRVSLIRLELPPLRNRPEDISSLAIHLLSHIALAAGRPGLHLLPGAMVLLSRHRWPGNVGELRDALQRAAALTRGDGIASRQMSEAIATKKATSTARG